MAIKTIRVFAEYTSDGYVPMPSQGNIDYGVTVGSTFPETQPSSFQTDDPNIDVAVTTMTDFYVWIRTHGSAWNPSYTRVVRVYPDSPSINSVVMNMIVAVGGGGTTISSGGGVSYYLNGGTSQGVLDGSTYYEMNKVPVEGTGVDFFKINTTGFQNIAQFVTDAGDPGLLNIPAGNWPLGFYMSASDNSGAPKFYAEIYKYSAAGVFTLLGSSVATPEVISNGQAIDFYTSNVAIPDTTLLVTDRIAIRIFVDTDGNRTINLHTQDSHLSTVGTTFTRGLTAINGLIKQVQFLAIGNAGSDAAIVSSDDTHTINLPTASATKRGLLNSTDWSTFNAKQPALSGDGFVKISGSTISYDNSSYQPLDGDLTAIGALAGTSGILKKTGANTWELDTTTYLSTGVAASTYQRLDKMVSNLLASDTEYPNSNAVLAALALKANATNPTFSGYLTISGASPKIYLTDTDNNPDYFIGNDDGYFRIYDQTNSLSRFYITNVGVSTFPGDVIVGSIAKSGGTASQFLKADGTVDSTTYATSASLADYLTSATAATTYQRLDKMVSNLLASDTEYPNSNAVLAKLALKADAANPSFTGSMNISGAESRVNFYDENAARKYFIGYDGGFLRIYQDAGSTSRFYINSSGKTFIPGTLEVGTIIKTSGTASQFLKADGTVDSNTYVSSTALADYLPLAGGTITGQILGPSIGSDVYGGAIHIRERGYVLETQSVWSYSPAITFHWGNRHAKRFGLRSDGLFAIDDEPIALRSWVTAQSYITASSLTPYLLSADAVTTYQRKDKMVSNLLASDTEYPNSNAVIAALALKADAANPTYTGNVTISGAEPKIYFTDTDQNPDYFIGVDAGYFRIYNQTAGQTKFVINSDGDATFTNSVTASSFIGNASTASLAANSSTLQGLTISKIFNNLGRAHGDPTDFNSITDFGPFFVQGTTNGPGTGSSQFYGISLGLGSQYPYSDYAMQFAIPRYGATDKYLSFRTRQATTWESWQKISAGYADTSGSSNSSLSLNGFANQTEYTILTGPANGPVWKVRYDSATANRYVDLGFKDGNGVYSEGFKIYNGGTPTWVGNTIVHAGNISSYSIPLSGGINLTGSFGLNDNKLYLRTNGDNNHYLWNADDDYEELRAYGGTGFRVRSSGGQDLLLVYGASNGAYTYSPYSFRSPRFYSSSDTGYFGDFADISSMWGIAIRGDNGASSNNNQIFFWGSGGTTTSSIGFKSNAGSFANPTGSGDGYNTYFTMDTPGRGWVFREGVGGTNFSANYTSGWILNNGIWQANSQMRAPVFKFTNSTNNTYLTGGSDWGFRASNDNGYIQFGPANNSWSHIYSDKNFYFNQDLYVNGTRVVLNSGTWGISISGNATTAYGWSNTPDSWSGIGQSTGSSGATAVGGYYPWTLSYHTGLAFSAHSAYGGIRFYNQNYPVGPMASTPVMQIINGGVQTADLSSSGSITVANRFMAPGLSIGYWDGVYNRIESATRDLFITSYTNNIKFGNSGSVDMTFGSTRNLDIVNPESYSGTVRLGAAWSRGGVYAGSTLSMATSSGNIDFVSNDNTIGGFRWDSSNGTRFIVGLNGNISTPYTLIDANKRPVMYSRGAYPVLTLDHTETSNTSHGPTIQFTFNGLDNRQWVIGAPGNGSRLDFGMSNAAYGNNNYNPHNGIAGYTGKTIMRMTETGVLFGDCGNYPTINSPGYSLQVNGSFYVSSSSTFATTASFTATTYPLFAFSYGNTAAVSGQGLQVYSTGGNGAIMAFHRGGYYAVNMGLDSDNVFRIGGWSASANRLQLDMSGNLTVSGSSTATAFYESSDSRLKNLLEDDIQVIGIENLKAKRYIKNGKEEYGYFAQDAETYMPSVVTRNSDGYLNLSYREVHTAKIARLEQRVAELEKQLNVA